MLCSVCSAENDHLATVCSGCGSYLQQRVDNLDLFACAWSVVEGPTKGFRRIALARHKNYIVVLSAAAGVAFVFGFFWLANAGEYADNLINILGAGLVLGPPAGIVLILLVSGAIVLSARAMKLRVRLRDAFAVSSYASLPLIFTALLFLPIELISFGPYFFMKSPSPYLIRPFSYVTLLGLDAAFALWSVVLLLVGVRVLLNAGWARSAAAVASALLVAGGLTAALLRFFTPGR
jgi:hypothetical protein